MSVSRIEKEDWRNAPGVIVEIGETNGAFAKRDYSVGCNTEYCITVIKGYWLWWCSAHHQPASHCEITRLGERLAKLEKEGT